jgi:hypothetical protein
MGRVYESFINCLRHPYELCSMLILMINIRTRLFAATEQGLLRGFYVKLPAPRRDDRVGMNFVRLRESSAPPARIHHATGSGVINKQHEHANDRYFDVPSTYVLALSATGFGGVEAIPH